MDFEFELTKSNRLKLANAFRDNKRVDFSIECVLEGQMGKAFVDNLVRPTAYRITVGPFWYYAGDARSNGGHQMMEGLPAYNLLMPSPVDWLEVAHEVFDQSLRSFPRYSFSATNLSSEHLEHLVSQSPYREHIIPIDAERAAQLAGQPESYFDLSDFDSIPDFLERSLAFTIIDHDTAMGVAYSSLVCSRGIEVSVFVEERYRQRGVATALSSRLLLECLKRGLRPNWDAANPESCKLAQKLGFVFVETYDAFFHTRQQV